MRNHRTTAELESIVGADRGRHTHRQVVAAQRELALRAAGEASGFQRKLSLGGTASAVIGAFCIFWSVLMSSLFIFSGLTASPSAAVPHESFPFANFEVMFLGTGVFQAGCGILLLFGGLYTRRRRPRGPSLISAAIILCLVYVVAFTLFAIPSFFSTGTPAIVVAVFAFIAVLSCAFWGFLLWLPLRFFTSPRVREACRAPAV